MTACEQLLYRRETARHGPFELVAASCADPAPAAGGWQLALDAWLRVGQSSARGYLAFGETATLIRWMPGEILGSAQERAHVLVAPSATLTPNLALRLPDWDWNRKATVRRGRLEQVGSDELIASATDLRASARSGPAAEQMVPLLAQILAGKAAATVPWTPRSQPEAGLWGLLEILQAIGDDRRLSFVTCGTPPYPGLAGLLLSYGQDITAEPPELMYDNAAIAIVTCYADNGAPALGRLLTEHRVLDPADREVRVRRMLELWPGSGPPERPAGESMDETTGGYLCCPVCLSRLTWSKLPLWRWDSGKDEYVQLDDQSRLTPEQRNRHQRSSAVRCPDDATVGEHYLPADYGRYGTPTILGFIGATRSGKSHLLAAMVGAIEKGGLSDYGVQLRPVDYALHQKFVVERVRPLLNEGKVLEATPEGLIGFVDAFVIGQAGGSQRAVALFDVAGGELTSVHDAKRFLELVDGLIFVVDPAQLRGELGDETFSTVLYQLQASGRLPRVSAAVVLNKADLVRFDDPITRWLRSGGGEIDADLILEESADVYAYLHSQGAQAWTRPYDECAKATLHVTSPTGGPEQDGVYPRGVTPCRVLAPLVALLAMTGVLTGPQAQRVGI
jgi:Double-GTPase 2